MANTKKLTKEERKKAKRLAQEDENRKAEEAPRLRARIEKAQSEEIGTRPG
jgi:hypothetical protein